MDFEVLIILGRPFLALESSLVDKEKVQMMFRLTNEEETFDIVGLWSRMFSSNRYLP